MNRKIASRSLAIVAFAITLSVAVSSAQVQQPTQTVQTATDPAELSPVTVTGYLIPRVGEGPQPVVTLDRNFISEQADQTVSDLLNRFTGGASDLTAITFTGVSSSPASSAYGLRGLPPNATLVLVDGYRFPNYPFPFGTTFVDLNSIPLAAVDRVEILKDGASSTYGSDAVAGVVNVVTKEDYNGADITNYFGISQRGDYEVYHGSFTAGISDKPLFGGQFNIVAAFDYYSQSPIESLNRWYAYGDRSKLSPNYPDQPVAFFPANGAYIGNTSSNFYQLKRSVSGSNITQNDFTVNGAADETYLPIDEQLAARETRYGGTLNAIYSPNDWLRFYDRFIITRNEENAITPNQGFSQGDGIVIPAVNPYNPWREALTPTGQLLREFGPWSSDVITRTLRNIVGLTVQLPHDWFIDASFLYGESDSTQTGSNAIIKDRLQEALNGTLAGFEGQFFNPFNDENLNIDPNRQFYNALRTEQIENSRTDLVQWNVKSGGALLELPSGMLTVAGGLEYSSESLIQGNDQNSEIGNIASGNFLGKQLSGRRYIKSAFCEMDLPLVGENWSWPGAKNVDFVFSERYDNYSDFGAVEKPKFAIRYKPVDDLTLRATYAEGFIAPSLNQLFAPVSTGLVTIFDPVKNQTYDVGSVSGGNPRLQPETSYSYYAEAIWTPASNAQNGWWSWAKGFNAYVDWYEILIRNQIGATAPQTLVGAESVFPGGVTRNTAGFITQINGFPQNIITARTDGLDFGASYITKEYGWGKLDLELNATYIYNYSVKRLEGLEKGGTNFLILRADDSFTLPDFKLVASLFYTKRTIGSNFLRTGFTLNYVDSEHDGIDNFKGSLPAIDAGLNPPGYVHLVGSWTTLDWQFSYGFGPLSEITPTSAKPGFEMDGKRILGEQAMASKPQENPRSWWKFLLSGTTFTFGINNIFDTAPPLSTQGGTFFQGFDALNATPLQRYFYVQVEKKF